MGLLAVASRPNHGNDGEPYADAKLALRGARVEVFGGGLIGPAKNGS